MQTRNVKLYNRFAETVSEHPLLWQFDKTRGQVCFSMEGGTLKRAAWGKNKKEAQAKFNNQLIN